MKDILLPLVIVGAILLLGNTSSAGSSTATKRQRLVQWVNSWGDSEATKQEARNAFQSMTDSEIGVIYDWAFNYFIPKKPAPTAFAKQAQNILSKYGLIGT